MSEPARFKQNNKQLFLIFLAYYGITCFSNIYFVFGPFYESLGATPQAVGLFLSVFYFVMLFCRPVGSFILERFNIRRTLIGSSLLCVAASAGIAFTLDSVTPLLFFRALTGVCVSVFSVAAIAAQSIILDEKSRGFGFALFTTGSLLPMATIVPLSEWLQNAGLGTLYLWLPAITAALCAAVSFFVKDIRAEKEEDEVREWGSYTQLLSYRGVKPLLATAFVMSIADAMTLSVASLAATRGVAVSGFMISEGISGVVIRTIAFPLIARFPRRQIAAPAAILMGATLVALSFSSSPLTFCIAGAIFGLGIGAGFPTDLAMVSDLLPLPCRPKATGLVLLILDLGWMISPLIFGFLSPMTGAPVSFVLIGTIVTAASAALYIKFWHKF